MRILLFYFLPKSLIKNPSFFNLYTILFKIIKLLSFLRILSQQKEYLRSTNSFMQCPQYTFLLVFCPKNLVNVQNPLLFAGAWIFCAGSCRLRKLDHVYFDSVSVEEILARICGNHTPPNGPS